MNSLDGQTNEQNIISLFGNRILDVEEVLGEECFEDELMETFEMGTSDIFATKIAGPHVSLESGFYVIEEQIKELKLKTMKTSFYLTDLENLLT